MRHSFPRLLTFLYLICACWSAAISAQPGDETEIFRIELVTRFDATIDGGGFESRGPVDRRLVKDVSKCIDAVQQTAIEWSEGQQLDLALKDRRDTSLILHFSRSEKAGIYEVSYRVDLSEGFATGGFKYFAPTGFEVPESSAKYKKFRKQLRRAMSCE